MFAVVISEGLSPAWHPLPPKQLYQRDERAVLHNTCLRVGVRWIEILLLSASEHESAESLVSTLHQNEREDSGLRVPCGPPWFFLIGSAHLLLCSSWITSATVPQYSEFLTSVRGIWITSAKWDEERGKEEIFIVCEGVRENLCVFVPVTVNLN